jgi:hypothetical protein
MLKVDQPEFKKPPGILCQHNTGTGCGIYETRPRICRTWHCLWRRVAEMPDHIRPDKLGVMFSVEGDADSPDPFRWMYIVARAVHGFEDLEKPDAVTALDMFMAEGSLPVWAGFDGYIRMLYPDARLADAILNPSATVWQHLVPQGLAWRKKWHIDEREPVSREQEAAP